MKKALKISVAVAAATVTAFSALTFTACAKKHVHDWAWQRDKEYHWQYCTDKKCEETRYYELHDEETDSVCDTCAEFKALAFGFTQGGDDAHADFAREANVWFPEKGKELGFTYRYASDFVNSTSSDFSIMTDETLEKYDLIVLLNDKPNTTTAQVAFRKYIENGGACVAFHAAGFAMWFVDENDPFKAPSEFDDWFSNTFLRSGVYGYCDRDPAEPIQGTYWNTWNPTSEPMKIETYDHYVTESLEELELEDDTFISAPCEWYEWHHNLFEDDETTVLVSLNPTPENPAGDDKRVNCEHQVWQAGHHAIAWANSNYNMVYMNWGHNLRPYNISQGATEGGESSTFASEVQNQITLNAMFGTVAKSRAKK